jgi:hypothetical protein
VKELEIQNGCAFPFATGSPYLATVLSAQQLTCGEDIKKVVDVCLDIQVTVPALLQSYLAIFVFIH